MISYQWLTVHVERMTLYPAGKFWFEASVELEEQAAHFDATYHFFDVIFTVNKRKVEQEVRIK